MITKELISYIKQAHEAGNAKADTVKTLKEQGWLSADIEAAYQKALSLPSVPSAPQPSSSLPILAPRQCFRVLFVYDARHQTDGLRK